MDELVNYKISSDGEDEGLELVAFTDSPAILVKGVKLSTKKVQKFAVKTGERMIVAGPAMIPDMRIPRDDEDGEYTVQFTAQEIEKLVMDFKSRIKSDVFNVEHTKRKAPAFIFSDWIVEDPDNDTSNVYGFVGERALPKGTWFVMAKVTDERFWREEIENNERFGFSIEGLLGLKLNTKQNMSEKKKFSNALIEDGTKVYAEKFEPGFELYVIDDNGDKAPIYDGEHKLDDGTTVVSEGGKITEVRPKQDAVPAEMAEEEVKEEVKVEEKLAEEVVVETPAAVVDKGLTEEDVLKMIQPKLDELYGVIAALKNELVSEEIREDEEEKLDPLMAKMARLRSVQNFAKSK